MRAFFVLTLALALFAAVPAQAADALTGTVVSADPDQRAFTLQPEGRGGPVPIRMRSGRFPALIRPGQSVTVWGRWSRKQSGLFIGRNVTPGLSGHPDPDPTGVRSRLFQNN